MTPYKFSLEFRRYLTSSFTTRKIANFVTFFNFLTSVEEREMVKVIASLSFHCTVNVKQMVGARREADNSSEDKYSALNPVYWQTYDYNATNGEA